MLILTCITFQKKKTEWIINNSTDISKYTSNSDKIWNLYKISTPELFIILVVLDYLDCMNCMGSANWFNIEDLKKVAIQK